MRVVRFSTLAELVALAGQWEELVPARPMLSPHWLITWWEHYGTANRGNRGRHGRPELFVLGVYTDHGRLAGLAPWLIEPTWHWGNVVRFLGSGQVCTDDLTVLCRPAMERPVTAALARWLFEKNARCGGSRRPRKDTWNLLDLQAVDADDRVMRLLTEACAQQGAVTHRQPAQRCWRLPLPGTWGAYLARLSKSHRKRIRRLQRAYFDTGRAQMHWVASPNEFEPGFQILAELHQRYWTSQGQAGVFGQEPFATFHRTAAKRLLNAGNLRLGWLELDGRPVAAEYHLVGNSTVFAYQSGRAPEARDHQPGNLSLIATLRSAIRRGCYEFDFLRGDEPYKAHWRARPQPMVDIRILPPTIHGRVRHGAWHARTRAKGWLRAGRHALNSISGTL